MRWLFLVILVVHALIHLMGFAKAFGYAELPQLQVPISRANGLLWLAATFVLLLASFAFLTHARWWWGAALLAALLSQVVLFTSWSDAKYGTIANLLVLGMAIYGFASQGPLSLRAHYESDIAKHLASSSVSTPRVSEAELEALPEPVRCYLQKSGVVGQPHVDHFKATWRGRIRGGANEPWMTFSAQQYNFVDTPARFFFMEATRSGLPVDVYHAYQSSEASMRVRLLSLFPMVNAAGAEMTRSETVTILNDLCIVAPAALLDRSFRWQAIDARSARVVLQVGEHSASATLHFNEACELIDFFSDDRSMHQPDGTFERARWSTPISEYRTIGPYRLASRGEARWHQESGDYAYIELDLLEVEVNGN
jgi:hypothetical protein